MDKETDLNTGLLDQMKELPAPQLKESTKSSILKELIKEDERLFVKKDRANKRKFYTSLIVACLGLIILSTFIFTAQGRELFHTTWDKAMLIEKQEEERMEFNDFTVTSIKEGDFIFSLYTKNNYKEGEEVKIMGSLTYIGGEKSIELRHSSELFSFSVMNTEETLQFGTSVTDVSYETVLKQNKAYRIDLTETRYSYNYQIIEGNINRKAKEFIDQYYYQDGQYYKDIFYLPAGDYWVYLSADFSTGDDNREKVLLYIEPPVVVTVE